MKLPFREHLSPKVDEQPLLGAVTRHTSEDIADRKRLSVCNSDQLSVEIGDGPIIGCSYEVCVKVVNKSDTQSKPV
jgi:hypothetical protein